MIFILPLLFFALSRLVTTNSSELLVKQQTCQLVQGQSVSHSVLKRKSFFIFLSKDWQIKTGFFRDKTLLGSFAKNNRVSSSHLSNLIFATFVTGENQGHFEPELLL